MGYVKDSNVKSVTVLHHVNEDEEEEPLAEIWDNIIFS